MRRTAVVLLLTAVVTPAQPATRRATNLPALAVFPGFFHLHPIVVVAKIVTQENGEIRATDENASVRVIASGNAPDGLDEIRGDFWDLGRMKADDPRLAGHDLKREFHVDPDAPWPKPGDVTAIMAGAITPAQRPVAPSIRAIVLYPDRYLDQRVTVTGQYSGRNLFGDLPEDPAKSRWDFVVRTADAALWVTGGRPKGKGFDFALDRRLDTSRWLEISGTLRQGRGLQWIEVGADGIQLGKAPTETPIETEPALRVPAAPPPEVIFSAPTQDETDVALTTTLRIQFSRDIDPATITNNILVSYLEAQTVERGEPATPKAEFTTQYLPANRELVVTFAKPLERFRTVRLQLTDGIIGTDKQPLKAWTLTFSTGG